MRKNKTDKEIKGKLTKMVAEVKEQVVAEERGLTNVRHHRDNTKRN